MSSTSKLTPKVILEGTRLTHKTAIAFALNEHPGFVGPRRYRYHSPIVSAEWCGLTNTPWGRGLINFEPQEEEWALETYRTWMRLFELLRYYSWIVDRFHLSTFVWQLENRGRTIDFNWLEKRLLPLDFRIILCHRSPDSFSEARKARVEVSGNPAQYDDLGRFIDEQESFRCAVSDSLLPVLELDVSDDDIGRAANRIVTWMEATGGLSMA